MLRDCAVVIATHNRAATLRKSLEQLYDLPERPLIVVADNASDDETERAWKPFANRVHYLRLRRNIGAAARTIGAREAGTPFVAFCDDDCAWHPGALELAVERFEHYPHIAVLNGCVLVGEEQRRDPACQAMSEGVCGDCGVPIVYFMAGASIMRTSAFLDAGGYHVRYFIGAEESLLALDLAARGWQLRYCDDLLLHHHPSPLNRDPERRRRLVLRNRLWTMFLRRSASCALHALARYLRVAAYDRVARAALREAVAGLPWVLRERRAIPAHLEQRLLPFDNLLTP
jgi:GT2 family glycosyltransferase